MEKEWPSWESFYDGGPALLSPARAGIAHEDVDADHAALHETRNFRLLDMVGEHQNAAVELSCQLVTSDAGNTMVKLLASFQQHPGNSSVPDIIVLNSGLWGSVDIDSIFREGQRLLQLAGPDRKTRLIWKTTTSARDPLTNGDHNVYPQRERSVFCSNESL